MKLLRLMFFAFFISVASTGILFADDITSAIKLWILNNEAQTIAEITYDTEFINRLSLPFAFLPSSNDVRADAKSSLRQKHKKMYLLLDEIQRCYSLYRRFGNGHLAVLVQRARPEIWSLLPANVSGNLVAITHGKKLRQVFLQNFVKGLGMAPEQDMDLSVRINSALNLMSESEKRLFSRYLEYFSSLYPSDRSASRITQLLERVVRPEFSRGVSILLSPLARKTTSPVAAEIDASDDLELMSAILGQADVSGFDDSIDTTSEFTDTAHPETDVFNIWD